MQKKEADFTAFLLIILIAFSMRAPMSGVGPLIQPISESLGISAAAAGFITTLPLILFSLSALVSSSLISRFRSSKLISLYVAMIACGVVLRSNLGAFGLFAGTVLIGTGTGALNATMPAFIREGFPGKTRIITGTYSTALTLASAVSAAIVQSFSFWRIALFSSVVLIFPCLVVCLFTGRRYEDVKTGCGNDDNSDFKLLTFKNICIAFYMGLQSLVFYVLLSWYPTMMSALHSFAFRSGLLITITQVVGLIPAFVVPVVSGKADLRVLSAFLAALFIPGLLFAGLSHSNGAMLLGTVLLGIATGGSFSMGITFCAGNGKNGKDTAKLTAFGQFIGYLLAASGPVGIGYVFDRTDNWIPCVLILCAISLLMVLSGIVAGRKTV